jgi:hypothetical protein
MNGQLAQGPVGPEGPPPSAVLVGPLHDTLTTKAVGVLMTLSAQPSTRILPRRTCAR